VDSKRFDNWARNRALRLSRRDALRLAGVGGASAALAAPSLNAFAQSPCTLNLQGELAGGPSAPTVFEGTLQFSPGTDGTLSQASFTPAGGEAAPASGSFTGRALDIQIALGPGQILNLSGAMDQKGPACPTAAAGILAGPQPGDLGAWQATSGSGAPSLSSGQSSSVQTSASSSSSCAPGQVTCGGRCVAACPSGQSLDPSSCVCTANLSDCQPDQSPCESGFDCCSSFCDLESGACQPCGGLICGDMGCVDVATDPNNCGSCGTVCVDDTGFCLGGVCQCIPDNEPKGSSSSSCCSKSYVEPTGLCGCALLGEWCGSSGECCESGAGVVCVDDGSGFKTCCRQAGNACASDAECCFSSPAYSPQSACNDGVCGPKP
jgi:hypothetical protein